MRLLRESGYFLIIVCLATPSLSLAQTNGELEALKREVDAIRADHAVQVQNLNQQTDARIRAVEAAIAKLSGATANAAASIPPQPLEVTPTVTRPILIAPAKRFTTSGDVRLRYETNSALGDEQNRQRLVMRARLRATYDVTSKFRLGAQVSTGDPDDPNTTDVTLSNWNDDLAVSLDQLYLSFKSEPFQIVAGKFPNPIARNSEIVWDGDVSIAGLSAAYSSPATLPVKAKLTALHFVIDERARDTDSYMNGLQAVLDTKLADKLQIDVSAGYFDYHLGSVIGADQGDVRSNRVDANANYVSDFNLLTFGAAIRFASNQALWPIRLSGEIANNQGAAEGFNNAHNIELALGRSGNAGNFRVILNKSRVEQDAVLAAFSHDNFDIATSYEAGSLAIDYWLSNTISINTTWYHYRALDPQPAIDLGQKLWRDRLRLNLLVTF